MAKIRDRGHLCQLSFCKNVAFDAAPTPSGFSYPSDCYLQYANNGWFMLQFATKGVCSDIIQHGIAPQGGTMEHNVDNYELPLEAEIDAEALFMDMTRPPRSESDGASSPAASSAIPGEPKAPSPRAVDVAATQPSAYEVPTQANSYDAVLAKNSLNHVAVSKALESGKRAMPLLSHEPPLPDERRSTSQGPSIQLRERRAVRQGRRASDHSESQRFRDVWMTLRAIDCSTLSKTPQGGMHWYDVLDLLMTHFPQTSWEALTDVHHADGSMEVGCKVTVNGVSRSSTLQVETASGRLLVKPNAQQVSEARMRCWVRCVALFGLGLDIQKQTTH